MVPAAGKFRPAWVLLVFASYLLATNANAVGTTPGLETLCQDVQCPVDCPSDSELQSTASGESEVDELPLEEDGVRERRSIAMNNHPREAIKITPHGKEFSHQNQLQSQSASYWRWKRSVVANDRQPDHHSLVDVCCPQKCTCRPCPTQTCPPGFVPVVDVRGPEQTGQPGACCPHVHCERRCRSQNFPWKTFSDGDRWNEDPCVECRCEKGVRRCESPFCKSLGCSKQIKLPDQCCPVCDETDSMFCPGHANCALSCRHGFQQQPSGCALCACSRKPPALNMTSTGVPVTTTAYSSPTETSSTTTTVTATTNTTTPPATDSEATPDGTFSNGSFTDEHPDTVQPGAVQHVPYDIAELGNSSTHDSSVEHSDAPKSPPVIWQLILYGLGGILFAVAFIYAVVLAWRCVQDQHRGKYSTVPISSSNSTSTTTTTTTAPNGTITASTTSASINMI
ncbi:uncharacterized protein LOC131261401 isoform X1 [Anopheles coustani]|uniref:uncharacterized protein LOC131261401 isoform X1 n=1 Tax=Anopheles coustani TaxID=139045 RepID=UPI0026596E40|nr:uncharacterized protein LOC131261401 isoform X1 [Anopheles coustani]